MTTRSSTGARRAGGRTGTGTGMAAGGTNGTLPDGARPAIDEIPGDPEQSLGDPGSVARSICLRLLTQRARSRAELGDALARRGVPDDSAEAVLDRFTEVGLIDDAALAQSMAGAQHEERGLARRAVAIKLRRRGLDEQVVRDALTVIDSDSERHKAQELVRRRQRSLATLPVEVQKRRLVGMLARKGYPSSMAYEAVHRIVEDTIAGDDVDAPADDSGSPAAWDDDSP